MPKQTKKEEDSYRCRMIKRALVGFALVVTVAVIIIMAVDSAGSDESSNTVSDVTCIKSSSYDTATLQCTDYPCISEYQSVIDTLATDSTSWDEATAREYLLQFHETELGQCIQNVNTTCTLRPAPSCYLPENVINYHLSTFLDNGASFISSTKYAAMSNFTELGYEPDNYDANGVQWVTPYNQEMEMLQNCGSSTTSTSNAEEGLLSAADCVLTALGTEIGEEDMFRYDWGKPTVINRVMQVNVYKTVLEDLNLRMASGNEQGTDSEWRAGGYTIDGAKEAVVDMIYEDDYCWNALASPNGIFCFDSCEIVCDTLGGCLENSCSIIE